MEGQQDSRAAGEEHQEHQEQDQHQHQGNLEEHTHRHTCFWVIYLEELLFQIF